jgi:WD40 repeat protein
MAGDSASIRSDIYSLGVMLYQLVVGDLTRPLTADWTEEVEDALLREDLRHCCARRPEDRFAGASQLAMSLRGYDRRKQKLEERSKAERKAQQRHRLVRLTSSIAVLLLMLTLALGYGLKEAEKQRRVAEANLYAADINLAFRYFQENNLEVALDLLERHRPKPGQRDLRDWEWAYLWQQCQSDERCTLGSHSNFVNALAISPDAQLLASGGRDQTVKVWELDRTDCVATLLLEEQCRSLDFSPDGRWLATGMGSGAGGIRLYDTQSWKPAVDFGGGTLVRTVAFSPDGQQLATGGPTESVLWDLTTQEQIVTLPGRDGDDSGASFDFSPDGRWLAYARSDKGEQVCFWDVIQRQEVAALHGHEGRVTSVVYSPDGTLLATSSWDETVRIWDARHRESVATLTNHTAWVSSVAFSPDGATLVSVGADHLIRLWSTTDWRQVGTLKGHRHEIWALAIAPHGRWLATGSKDESVRVWDLAPPAPRRTILPRPQNLAQAVLSAGAIFPMRYTDGTIRYAELPMSPKPSPCASPFAITEITSSAISADGEIMAHGLTNHTVRIWETESQAERWTLGPFAAPIHRLSFSTDGKRLAGLTTDSRFLYVWSVIDGQQLVMATSTLGAVLLTASPLFSPDTQSLAMGHTSGDVSLWQLGGKRAGIRLAGHKGAVFSLAFSPNGRLLATTSDDGTMKLWDTTSCEEQCTLRGQLLSLHGVGFAPSGRRVAAGTGGGRVSMWDVETLQQLATFEGPPGRVLWLRFHPDTQSLVAVSWDELHLLTVPSWEDLEPQSAQPQ